MCNVEFPSKLSYKTSHSFIILMYVASQPEYCVGNGGKKVMKYSIEFCLSKYDFHKCKYFIMMREKDLECLCVAGLLAVEAAPALPS